MDLKYYDYIKNKKRPEKNRLKLILYAKQNGIKAAAREFATTVRTVRKWLRRFDNTLKSLKNRPKKPHSPRETPMEIKEQIIKFKKEHPKYTAKMIKEKFNISISVKTMLKIFKQKRRGRI